MIRIAAQKCGFTPNESKFIISSSFIKILGYDVIVNQNTIRADPGHLYHFRYCLSLRWTLGISYYSKWSFSFSNKIRPLINTESFPISKESLGTFNESVPFLTECDASDVTVSATLNQKWPSRCFHVMQPK